MEITLISIFKSIRAIYRKLPLLAVIGTAFAQVPINNLPPATLPLQPSDAVVVNQTVAGKPASRQAPVSAVAAASPVVGASYLLQSTNAGLSNSRTLVGTANEVVLTDGGPLGSLTLSTPQPIGLLNTPTFSGLTLTGLTGVLKASAGVLGPAGAADVIALWSGTCSASTFLRGDGACAAPAGTVSSVGLTAPSVFAVSGSPVTSSGTLALSFATGQTANQVLASPNGGSGAVGLRALVGADLPPINLGSTANGGVLSTSTLPVAQGGTGLATLPVHGVLLGEAAANVGNVAAMVVDTVLQGKGATVDPAATALTSCSAANQAVTYNTSTHAFGCQTVAGTVTGLANPTGTIGLTAVNGTATTAPRSDSAPALSQSIAPTWTAQHTFTAASSTGTTGPVVLKNDLAFLRVLNTAATQVGGLGTVEAWLASGTDVTDLAIGSLGTVALYAAGNTNPSFKANGVSAPTVQGWGPVSGGLVDLTPDSGSFTGTPTGGTFTPTTVSVTWRRNGNLVCMTVPGTTGTSNAATFTITGTLPASIVPTTGKNMAVSPVEDNGGFTRPVNVTVVTGVLGFSVAGSGGGWTATGTKGISSAIGFCYDLS